ncbi:MAG: flagellar hook basal-body protein [Melioribacteraceae bacterium]|nr:flagellar hook basal-body protein [Melioribacteraceae bacterium]
MIKGLYQAASNLIAKQKNIDITANNLANINTTGFKREVPFSEVMARLDKQPAKQITDLSKGSFVKTSNTFDLAISGDAFFMVKSENGTELTSNGNFKVDDEGFLSDANGNRVMGVNGEIDLTEAFLGKQKTLEINKEGEIKLDNEIINKLLIGKIDDSLKMTRVSGQNFAFTEGGYTEAGVDEYEINQGYLEESNINPVIEMKNMIQIEKDFEATKKMIGYMDQLMAMNKEIGRI